MELNENTRARFTRELQATEREADELRDELRATLTDQQFARANRWARREARAERLHNLLNE